MPHLPKSGKLLTYNTTRVITAQKNAETIARNAAIDSHRRHGLQVFENEPFVAFAPAGSQHAYEQWVVPKRHQQEMTSLSDAELLAVILRTGLPGKSAVEFGRELLTAKLVGRLGESTFLSVVVGASGSGKSTGRRKPRTSTKSLVFPPIVPTTREKPAGGTPFMERMSMKLPCPDSYRKLCASITAPWSFLGSGTVPLSSNE